MISQLIAFSMYETGSLSLSKEVYSKIVKSVSQDRIEDFAVSNYYYIESSRYTLSFCHKTIYEYFVAEYIYNILGKCCEEENIAKKLAYLLKSNLLTEEILKFLIYKIKKNCKDNRNLFFRIESVINLMVAKGMTYFLEEKKSDILKTERTIFVNIFMILDAYKSGTEDWQYKNIEISSHFFDQLNNRLDDVLNIKRVIWDNKKLNKMKFLANLDLSDSRLYNINFEDSDLSHSVLKNMELDYISFSNAVLVETIFDGSKIQNMNMNYANLSCSRFIRCELKDFNGERANFERCFFENAQIIHSKFIKSDLRYASFENATIVDTDFSNAFLENANFSGTKLIGVNLHLAQQINSVKINKKTVFKNVTIDSTLVHKLLKYNLKHIEGLQIYDIQKNKEMSLEEYKTTYNIVDE